MNRDARECMGVFRAPWRYLFAFMSHKMYNAILRKAVLELTRYVPCLQAELGPLLLAVAGDEAPVAVPVVKLVHSVSKQAGSKNVHLWDSRQAHNRSRQAQGCIRLQG